MKLPLRIADQVAMSASDLSAGVWLLIAAVIVVTILQILRFICEKIAHEVRLHQLTVEATLLRKRYVERMEADRQERLERSARSRIGQHAAPPPIAAAPSAEIVEALSDPARAQAA